MHKGNANKHYYLKFFVVLCVLMIFWKTIFKKRKLPEPLLEVVSEFTLQNTVGKVIRRNLYTGWIVENDVCEKVDDSFVLAKLNRPPDTPIYVYPEKLDQFISRDVIRTGTYEDSNVAKISEYMKRFPNAIFIDVGAYIGTYSISIAAQGYRVIAIECLKNNVQRLCASMKKAGLQDKMTIVHNAVNDIHERISLVSEPENIGMTYVVNLGKGNDSVDCIMLDDLLQIFKLEQVILKIDVHKFEDIVLNSAQKFFQYVRVEAVLLEFIHHQKDEYNKDGQFIVHFLDHYNLVPDVPDHLKYQRKEWKSSEILFKRRDSTKREM